MVQGSSPLTTRHTRVMVALLAFMTLLAASIVCWHTIIGGVVNMVTQSLLPLPEVLRHASYVTIKKGSNDSQSLMLSEHDNPALLALLRNSTVTTPVPGAHPDYIIYINVTTSTDAVYRYDYILSTGKIGRGRDWCRVPPAFKDWMLVMTKKATPASRTVPTTNDGLPVVVSAPTLKGK